MSGYVLFQMPRRERQRLIDNHHFYIVQSKRHVLAQFANLDALADQAGDEWLQDTAHLFNPDTDDPGAAYEAAYERSIEAYQLLSDLRDNMRLAVITGMYHNWEKELRDWLAGEMQHWYREQNAYLKVWSADFRGIIDLLRCLQWNLPEDTIVTPLDRCRLVVNVFKHGPGNALQDLRKKYRELLDEHPGAWQHEHSARLYHARLKVTDDDLEAFSNAIVACWNAAPENVTASQIPSIPEWFEKAFEQDKKKKGPTSRS